MTGLLWLLPWVIAGVPIPSILMKLNLLKKSSRDYAYYLMLKELSVLKPLAVKLPFFLVLGTVFLLRSVSPAGMTATAVALGMSAAVLESSVVARRPYPTPSYRPSKTACDRCARNRHYDCTNLRMLDTFETSFRSKEGKYRPVCCCGHRISAWSEISV